MPYARAGVGHSPPSGCIVRLDGAECETEGFQALAIRASGTSAGLCLVPPPQSVFPGSETQVIPNNWMESVRLPNTKLTRQ